MFRITILLFALGSARAAREFDRRRAAFAFSDDTVPNWEVTRDGGASTDPAANAFPVYDRPLH